MIHIFNQQKCIGGIRLWHRENKEEEAEERVRSHPAGEEVWAEAVDWVRAEIVSVLIAGQNHPTRGVFPVLRSNALNAGHL